MLLPEADTRIVELRVPDTPNIAPEVLVGAAAAVDVAGHGNGRFVRPADRLHRPAAGPVLTVEGRPLPRTIEGYLPAGRRRTGVLTALLAPFALANLAWWMLPPLPERELAARRLAAGCRALVRLTGLLLTVLLVAQLTGICWDLLVGRCLAPGTGCLTALVPDGWRAPGLRRLVGVLPALAVVAVAHRQVLRSRPAPRPAEPQPAQPRLFVGLPGVDPATDGDDSGLAGWHLCAALAAIALLTSGGLTRPAAGLAAGMCWAVAVGLLALAVSAVLLPEHADRTTPGLVVTGRLAAALAAALIPLSTLLGLHATPLAGPPGPNTGIGALAIALTATCTLVAALLLVVSAIARPWWAEVPGELRPWAGGWAAAPTLALAALLGTGFGAAADLLVRLAVGLPAPAGYRALLAGWGLTGGLAALVVAGALVAARRWQPPEEVSVLHAGRPADAASAAVAWRIAGWLRSAGHRCWLALVAVLVAGTVVALVGGDVLVGGPAPGLGVLVVLLAAVGAARIGRRGSLAGLLGWPGRGHPWTPAGPLPHAVPELAARIAGHLAEPHTRVVLTGHGAGGLLAVATAARLLATLPPAECQRLGVVTAGSAVRTVGVRAVPAALPISDLVELYADLDGRWRSLCRGTDPAGGGVTTWRRQAFDGTLIGVGLRADHTAGALPASTAGPTGAQVLGGDHWLPDPQRGPFPGRRWTPGCNRHRDYEADPEWDRAVACAAGVLSPVATAAPTPLFRLPGVPDPTAPAGQPA